MSEHCVEWNPDFPRQSRINGISHERVSHRQNSKYTLVSSSKSVSLSSRNLERSDSHQDTNFAWDVKSFFKKFIVHSTKVFLRSNQMNVIICTSFETLLRQLPQVRLSESLWKVIWYIAHVDHSCSPPYRNIRQSHARTKRYKDTSQNTFWRWTGNLHCRYITRSIPTLKSSVSMTMKFRRTRSSHQIPSRSARCGQDRKRVTMMCWIFAWNQKSTLCVSNVLECDLGSHWSGLSPPLGGK